MNCKCHLCGKPGQRFGSGLYQEEDPTFKCSGCGFVGGDERKGKENKRK
jgi:hypothetical protein